MMARYEVRAVGYGGQGVITLSKLITTAIVTGKRLLAVHTEAYSAAARGGLCWAECVIELDRDVKSIYYPRALSPYDFLFVLSNEAYRNFSSADVKEDGWVVWDSSIIRTFKMEDHANILGIPAQEMAIKQLGSNFLGSAILFGTFTGLTSILEKDTARSILKSMLPGHYLEKNLKAFEMGYQFTVGLKKRARDA
ncbi:hypothetical protein GF325_16515 [Candidatus Bathyarchaeota archaeon]|nr:hypothetical protein [Candidatus Bathyarchaeota archaeon]